LDVDDPVGRRLVGRLERAPVLVTVIFAAHPARWAPERNRRRPIVTRRRQATNVASIWAS